MSSIERCGMLLEIGIAETQQVLIIYVLCDRVMLRTDGGMRSGGGNVKG